MLQFRFRFPPAGCLAGHAVLVPQPYVAATPVSNALGHPSQRERISRSKARSSLSTTSSRHC